MKRVLQILFYVSMGLGITGCGRDSFADQELMSVTEDTRRNNGDFNVSIIGSKNGVDDFLRVQTVNSHGYTNDECFNITPNEVSENSDFSIFKFNKSCASYLLYENKSYLLGEYLGGYGIVDMRLSDMNGDDREELYFTFSWGSGMHRSQAGYFDPVIKGVTILDFQYMSADMLLGDNEDGSLDLYEAVFSEPFDFINYKAVASEHVADIRREKDEIVVQSFE